MNKMIHDNTMRSPRVRVGAGKWSEVPCSFLKMYTVFQLIYSITELFMITDLRCIVTIIIKALYSGLWPFPEF